MSSVAGLHQRHHELHLRAIGSAALAVVSDKGAALADRLGHFQLGVGQPAEMADRHALRLYPHRFQQVQLLQRTLAEIGVREDGQVRLQVSLADRAENFALVRGHHVPRADLTQHAHALRVHLAD